MFHKDITPELQDCGRDHPESQWWSEKNQALLDMIDKHLEGISWEYDGWKVVHRQFNLVGGNC